MIARWLGVMGECDARTQVAFRLLGREGEAVRQRDPIGLRRLDVGTRREVAPACDRSDDLVEDLIGPPAPERRPAGRRPEIASCKVVPLAVERHLMLACPRP